MIEVEGLTKYYGNYKALDDISFLVEKGEIVGFLGRNGAGKTTTMRILSGYMPPSEGQASVAGFDVFDQSLEVRRRLGYLPETVPLYTEMTAWDYLSYMAELQHVRDVDEAVEETLVMVDLIDRADSLIRSLSKGMRQRMGLAQALVHKPEVLILDEPTIGLDPQQVSDLRELIRSLGEDRTVMLSTHILSEVQQICNRVLIIDQGRIVAEGTPDELSDRVQEAERIIVRVGDGDPLEEVADKLRALDGVTAVNITPKGLEVDSPHDVDIRGAVSAAIVNNGWSLLEVRAVEMELEQIFLQMTHNETEE